jgi:hypothetical protein
MNFSERGLSCTDWIVLGQDDVQWRDFVHTAMNLEASLNAGSFCPAASRGPLPCNST